MVDTTTIALAFVPLAVAGLGWSWKISRRWGALGQQVSDLQNGLEAQKANGEKVLEEINETMARHIEKLNQVSVDIATIKTDLTWVKEEIRNGHRPPR